MNQCQKDWIMLMQQYIKVLLGFIKDIILVKFQEISQKKKKKNCYTLKQENERKMYKWHSDLMKRCENSARIYAKNPTLENADQLYADIYNLPKNWRV